MITQELLNRLKLMGIYSHVVEAGSMREAAIKLGISAPAVSQYIRQLETELDVTLLYRSTRRISMSEAGEKYYRQSKLMLNAAEQAEDIIHHSKHSISGELRIALPVGLAALPIAQALAPVFEEHKELKLSITASDERVDFIQEQIDLVVDCGKPEDSSYIYHFLAENRKFICASPTYLKTHGSPVTPEELGRHTWLGLRQLESKGILSSVALSHINYPAFSLKPKPRFLFNDLNSLISHVQQGYGIALLPELEARHLIKQGEIVPLLTDWQIDKHHIFALTRDKKYPYKVKVALDALKTYFSRQAVHLAE